MKTIFRPIAIFLIPLLLLHFLILNSEVVCAEEKKITPVPPESVGEISVKPVEVEPVEQVKKEASGWWLVIVAVVIAAVAGVNAKKNEKTDPTIK